jgi:para-nitrobenzyl esterase
MPGTLLCALHRSIRKRGRIRSACFVLASLLLSSAALAAVPVVDTADGAVQGTLQSGVHAYLGIPYAAPPVGDLRWRAPRPAAPWSAILDATHFAPHCAQNASPFGLASQSEDCLYLNVYTPARIDERSRRDGLPVMVWVHGGALVFGESDDYDPSALVARGVVVVTINYRLGLLGFLVHPALAADAQGDGPIVNYGIRDQQAALHWVRRNIAAFGGDPRKVTVFGESAGGLSTLTHIVSPRSSGLLARAIVESGAYSLALPTLAQSEAAGAAIATALGCSDQTAACLRAAPLSAILANSSGGGYVPTVDGKVLPLSLGAALAAGKFNRVPVMQGSNHDEWRLFVGLDYDLLLGAPLTGASYATLLDQTYGAALGTAVLAQYPVASYASADLADAAQGTDSIFACTSQIAIQNLAQHVPVYAYEFSDPDAPQDFLPPVSFSYGAAHASELQYLFDLTTQLPHAGLNAAQQGLSAQMVDYWTRFAKDSDPNQRGLPHWPRYDASSNVRQNLTPGAVMPEYGFAADHHCAFWTPLLQAAGD